MVLPGSLVTLVVIVDVVGGVPGAAVAVAPLFGAATFMSEFPLDVDVPVLVVVDAPGVVVLLVVVEAFVVVWAGGAAVTVAAG